MDISFGTILNKDSYQILTQPFTHLHPLAQSLTHLLIHLHTRSVTHALAHSLTHSLNHSHTCSVTHALAQSLTHLLTHSSYQIQLNPHSLTQLYFHMFNIFFYILYLSSYPCFHTDVAFC